MKTFVFRIPEQRTQFLIQINKIYERPEPKLPLFLKLGFKSRVNAIVK